MIRNRTGYFQPGWIATIIIVCISSIIFSKIEYSFINLDSIPYRYAKQPMFGVFYEYQLIGIIPLISLFAFQRFVYEVVNLRFNPKNISEIKTTFSLGVACLLVGLVLEDAAWFMFRFLTPTASDPLAYHWITPSDYTAQALGYTMIFGNVVPLWYFLTTIAAAAILIALYVTPRKV